MKRRDFIIRSFGTAGALIPLQKGWANAPCPPYLLGGTANSAPGCLSPGTLPVGTLIQDARTPHQLALYAPVTGPLVDTATATLEYRRGGTGTWLQAHPLYRIDPPSGAPAGVVDAFAGVVFDLSPGQTYEVRVTYSDGSTADVRDSSDHGTFTTRALPAPAGNATKTANNSNLQSQINSLVAGDVLELQNGTYTSGEIAINVSGTASNPIYIRGASLDGVVIDRSNGSRGFVVNGSHIVLENLTMQGQGSINNGQIAIRLSSDPGPYTHHVTIRNIVARGFGRQVQTAGGTGGTKADNVLVYNCDFRGNAVWNYDAVASNLYWNEDGLRLVGTGNCVWNCTIDGQGDAVTFAHSLPDQKIYACFAYRNFIRRSADDCFELDYAWRNIGIYDNYCENVKTCVSYDPLFGGPSFVFRNVFANFGIRLVKPNTSGSGWFFYNNTFLKSDAPDSSPTNYAGSGAIGRGLYDASPATHNRLAFRNNIVIYRGTKTPVDGGPRRVYDIRWYGNDPFRIDWSHNAHYPDIDVRWTNSAAAFSSASEAFSGLPRTSPLFTTINAQAGSILADQTRRHSNDVATASDPFQNPISLGTDVTIEIRGKTLPVLSPGSSPKGAGIPIPGITDGYAGSQPDIGAIIEGRTIPTYGYVRPTP